MVELWIESVKNRWEVLNHKTNVGSLEWNQNFATSLRIKAMWIGPTLTKLFQDTHKKDRQETNCSFWPFLFYAKRNKQKKTKRKIGTGLMATKWQKCGQNRKKVDTFMIMNFGKRKNRRSLLESKSWKMKSSMIRIKRKCINCKGGGQKKVRTIS